MKSSILLNIQNMNGRKIKRIMALLIGIGTMVIIVVKILHDGLQV